jgi:hypothetical protein
MSKYTLTRPLLLKVVTAERIGEDRRLINPVVELTGADAAPMLAKGQVIPSAEDKGKPEALPIEEREYISVIELPDDIAKKHLKRGTLVPYEEPKKRAAKAVKKAEPKVENKEAK